MLGPAHLLILMILLVPYFLPTIIALVRKKRNAGAVAALNFFLGWTLIGWIVALVWALTVDAPPLTVTNVTNYPVQSTAVTTRAAFCQTCGAKLQPEARFCPSCGKSVT